MNEIILGINKNEKIIMKSSDRRLNTLILGKSEGDKSNDLLETILYQDMKGNQNGITVIDNGGQLRNEVMTLARYNGKNFIELNPSLKNNPCIDLLKGELNEVISNLLNLYDTLDAEFSIEDRQINKKLFANSIKVVKLLNENAANLLQVKTLIENENSRGEEIFATFLERKLVEGENEIELAEYFKEYFNKESYVYKKCTHLRMLLKAIFFNEQLSEILNPKEDSMVIDLKKSLEEGDVIYYNISFAGSKEWAKYLGLIFLNEFIRAIKGRDLGSRKNNLYMNNLDEVFVKSIKEILVEGVTHNIQTILISDNLMKYSIMKEDILDNVGNFLFTSKVSCVDANYLMNDELETTIEVIKTERTTFNSGGQKIGSTLNEVEYIRGKVDVSVLTSLNDSEIIYMPYDSNLLQCRGEIFNVRNVIKDDICGAYDEFTDAAEEKVKEILNSEGVTVIKGVVSKFVKDITNLL